MASATAPGAAIHDAAILPSRLHHQHKLSKGIDGCLYSQAHAVRR